MTVRQARFQIHRSQKIAAAFLLVFCLQSLWLLAHLPLTLAETRNVLAGESLWSSRRQLSQASPLIPGDSILTLRLAGLLPSVAQHWQTRAAEFSIYAAPDRWLVRLPFVLFGVWLGAALWWVARRLFSDVGGYVALALYCFSPPMLIASATVNSAVLAAWGLFGLVFTAIGVAHTLYAPARKFRPRVLLLGTAIGLTAAANVYAALAGLIFAIAFMLYLAPGKRALSLGLLATSTGIGALLFLLCFGFSVRDLRASAVLHDPEVFRLTAERVKAFLANPGGVLETFAFVAGLLVFFVWKRPRYFGNAAPIVVAGILPWWPGPFTPGAAIIWSLPFVFVFIGGIYADLLEPEFFFGRFRRLVATTAFVLIGASLLLGLVIVVRA
jgi:hypothetical protein